MNFVLVEIQQRGCFYKGFNVKNDGVDSDYVWSYIFVNNVDDKFVMMIMVCSYKTFG